MAPEVSNRAATSFCGFIAYGGPQRYSVASTSNSPWFS